MRDGMSMKAKRKPSLDEILARNPHLSRDQVIESLKLRQQFRKNRGKATGYGLASPSTQRRVTVRKDLSDRIINLRRASG